MFLGKDDLGVRLRPTAPRRKPPTWFAIAGIALVLAALWIEARGFEMALCLFLAAGLFAAATACSTAAVHRPALRRVALVLWLGLLSGVVLGQVGSAWQNRRTRAFGDRIAAALAAYRQQHGCYPMTLAELVPAQLAAVPATGLGLWRPTAFQFERQGQDYRLWFPSSMVNICERGPVGVWYDHD